MQLVWLRRDERERALRRAIDEMYPWMSPFQERSDAARLVAAAEARAVYNVVFCFWAYL